MHIRKFALGLAIGAIALLPISTQAQSYEQRLSGRVISSAPYNLQLTVGPHIFLHRGTVINPTGLTLRYGMLVRVIGHPNADGSFSADEIDLIARPLPYWQRRY